MDKLYLWSWIWVLIIVTWFFPHPVAMVSCLSVMGLMLIIIPIHVQIYKQLRLRRMKEPMVYFKDLDDSEILELGYYLTHERCKSQV